MRVLVTGAAGFIGFHCSRALMRRGHQVHGFDNLNDYYLPSLKEARLARLMEEGVHGFSRHDLEDLDAMEKAFKSFKPDAVLHLAAQAGVRYSLTHPHAYVQANLVGTMNILECCRHHGLPRLVYASSSSVYGGNQKLPFSVADRVDHPISLYAATKKANELMAHTYTHLYGLHTVGLRFFTVYGPWGRPDMAMWLFADAILTGRPIKVFNHGDMYRDFTYIDDIVSGVVASLESNSLESYELFNLGNHRSEHLMHMIDILESHLGQTAEKLMLPMQEGDVRSTYADIEAAREKLGFVPTTPIEQGIPLFVEWFKAHPEFHSA
ncbi:MAG: NAD-dependent epimerase/dehydratase family protein [Acidobacteria bacterium]|nr:NAD-dependent epimerase/dehydratase family protein [Acidobacteriota bacterium]